MDFWFGLAVGYLTAGPIILIALAIVHVGSRHDD
jgi:hypothetical protein